MIVEEKTPLAQSSLPKVDLNSEDYFKMAESELAIAQGHLAKSKEYFNNYQRRCIEEGQNASV